MPWNCCECCEWRRKKNRGRERNSKLQRGSLNPPDRTRRLDFATEGTRGIMWGCCYNAPLLFSPASFRVGGMQAGALEKPSTILLTWYWCLSALLSAKIRAKCQGKPQELASHNAVQLIIPRMNSLTDSRSSWLSTLYRYRITIITKYIVHSLQ